MGKLRENGFNTTKSNKANNILLLVSFAPLRGTCLGINNPFKASFSFLMIGGLK